MTSKGGKPDVELGGSFRAAEVTFHETSGIRVTATPEQATGIVITVEAASKVKTLLQGQDRDDLQLRIDRIRNTRKRRIERK